MPQEIVYIKRDDFRPWFISAVCVHAALFVASAFLLALDLRILLTDPRPILGKAIPFLLASYHLAVLALIPFALMHMYRAKKMKLWHVAVIWYPFLFSACADIAMYAQSLTYLDSIQ